MFIFYKAEALKSWW